MSNVYWGIFIVVISLIGYTISFGRHRREQYTFALILLVILGLVLRVYTSFDPLHEWDERYHALVAKNLLHHFLTPTLYNNPLLPYDYKDWGNNFIWLHKQPLTLWFIAVSLKVFGIHSWAVRAPSILFSTISIKLVYDIARYLYNRQTAFISAFLFSIHGLIIELTAGRSATDHIDITFLFFILLSIWCSTKYISLELSKYIFLTGLSLGCALLTKWLPALIVLPIWLLLAYRKYSHVKILLLSTIITVIAVIVAVPWQLYIFKEFPIEAKWEYEYNQRHFFEALEGHRYYFLYHFDNLRMFYGELIYLPVLWFLYKTFKFRQQNDVIISTWFLLPFLFYSFAATKMPAYTLIAAPAIFIIAANAFVTWKNELPTKKSSKFIMKAIVYGLILLPIRYSIERIKPFTKSNDEIWMDKITEIKHSHLNRPNTVIFNFDHPIEMMFYTNCVCYSSTPAQSEIVAMQQKNYEIIILKK